MYVLTLRCVTDVLLTVSQHEPPCRTVRQAVSMLQVLQRSKWQHRMTVSIPIQVSHKMFV
jgi:hypothetical protein